MSRGTIRGKRADLGSGGFPYVTLAEARHKAFEYRKTARSGGDPRLGAKGVDEVTTAAEGEWHSCRAPWSSHGVQSLVRRHRRCQEVAEAALTHVVRNKVEAAYPRGTPFARRRTVMEDWADYVAGRLAIATRRTPKSSSSRAQYRTCDHVLAASWSVTISARTLKEKIAKRGAGLGLAVALWKGADVLWGIASLMSDLGWWVVLGITSGAPLVGPEAVRFGRSIPGRLGKNAAEHSSDRKPARDASTFERRERHGKPYWVAPDDRRWVLPDDMARDLANRPPVSTLERRTRSSKIDPKSMVAIKSARQALADGLVARFMAEHPESTVGDLVDAVAVERWVKSYILEKIEAAGRSEGLGGRMGDGLNWEGNQ